MFNSRDDCSATSSSRQPARSYLLLAFSLILLSQLQGCVSTKPVTAPPTVASDADAAAAKQPQPIPVQSVPRQYGGAVADLLRQAERSLQAQDWPAAIAAAERGLRIERRSARLYLVLARSYEQLGEVSHAQAFARQGQRYTPKQSELWQTFGRILNAR